MSPRWGWRRRLSRRSSRSYSDLNAKEGVSFLLAEQNTNMALKYASYGYILENGRVVMDGEASRWRRTRTSRSSTLASPATNANPSGM